METVLADYGLELTAARKAALKNHRAEGRRTKPCVKSCKAEDLLALSREGVSAATFWVKVLGLKVPEPEAESPASKSSAGLQSQSSFEGPSGSMDFDVCKLRREHVALAAMLSMPLRQLEHPAQAAFLKRLNAEYSPPPHTTAQRILSSLDQEVSDKLKVALAQNGPWALSTDGASSRDDRLWVLMAQNLQGERMVLEQQSSGAAKQSADVLANVIRPWVQVPYVTVALTTDCGSNAKACGQQLERENSRAEQRPFFTWQPCGEHASQLLTKDLLDVAKWLQDSSYPAIFQRLDSDFPAIFFGRPSKSSTVRKSHLKITSLQGISAGKSQSRCSVQAICAKIPCFAAISAKFW